MPVLRKTLIFVMEQSKKIKLNRTGSLSIKIAIALMAAWFIYRRIIEKENIPDLFYEYRIIFSERSGIILLTVILLLMLINWSVEAVKWKIMIAKIESITFLKSFEAVFSGLTISFFTPNRIGEYAGRVFHLKTADRIKATLITVIENLSQLLVTLVAGSAALLFYLSYFLKMEGFVFMLVTFFILLFMFSCVLIFINVSFLEIFLRRFSWAKSWMKYVEVFTYYSRLELTGVILLALLRYIIFTTQFYLLLILFDIQVSYPVAMMLIMVIFYVMSLVPTIALTEIGVRGAVATFFLGQVTNQAAEVFQATVSLWLINLAIPALTGTVFIFMFKLEKEKA